MHWWQGAFSSSSKLQDDDDTVVKYSAKPGFFASRRSRLMQRARKLRHINENDGELCPSPSKFENSPAKSPASATPQPLPLPELHVLFRGDHKVTNSISYGVPLPSPIDAVQITRERGGGGCEERELNGDVNDGVHGVKSRIVDQDTRANAEHSETRSSKKSPQRGNAREIYSHTYSINIPTTSPNSPYSCQTPSPPTSEMLKTQYMTPPGVFHVWSAPEMRHSDRNLALGFSYRFPSEKTASSFENSSLQSPSNHVRVTSPPRSASPLNTKIHSDSPLGWRESNAQTTVHPLPLPPLASISSQTTPISPVSEFSGASVPSQSTPISSNAAKPEFLGSNVHSQPSPMSPASKPIMKPIKSQWQKGKLIGRGTFGSVYVASNRETGALCAMKEVEILPDDSKSAESIRQLEQEIKVLSHLKHPNIVQYYGSEIVGDKFHIYLEYVHPGSINKFIHDHCEAITESVVRNFTRHILSGLAYLHSKKTIHRDIKGANLLVDAYGVVKLADFGMAKHLSGQAANLSLKGSPYWLAPELLQSVMQKDTSTDLALAVDIWSLGCTIIEMMDGKPPWSEYEGAAALFKVLQETPPIPETLSAEGKDFLQCCFHRNPADRPTASKLLDHPFLNY